MATRYTDEKKKEVVEFVKKYDQQHGRGGQSAAKKKFEINPISIKKWCVEQGYSTPSSKKKGKKPAKRTTKQTTTAVAAKSAAAPVKAGSRSSTLAKMTKIQAQIESLQSEFDSLKAQL